MNWRGRISIGLGVLVVLAAGAGVMWHFAPHLLYRTEVSIHTGSAWLRTQYYVVGLPFGWRDEPTFVARALEIPRADLEKEGDWLSVEFWPPEAGRAAGAFAYRDFLRLAFAVERLEAKIQEPSGLYALNFPRTMNQEERAKLEAESRERVRKALREARQRVAAQVLEKLRTGDLVGIGIECRVQGHLVAQILSPLAPLSEFANSDVPPYRLRISDWNLEVGRPEEVRVSLPLENTASGQLFGPRPSNELEQHQFLQIPGRAK